MRSLLNLAVALGMLIGCGDASAGIVKGTIKSASAREIEITVSDEAGKGQTQRFGVGSAARVTLDGRRTRLQELRPGLPVTVFTVDDDRVLRVAAETKTPEPVAAKPSPAATETRSSARSSTEPRTASRSGASRAAAGIVNSSWSQFRGPNRENLSPETGLLDTWPSEGPPLAWIARGMGEGYATVAIDRGLVISMGNVGADESVVAVRLEDGRPAWTTRIAGASRLSAGNGPRCTPTIDGERLYALGGNGDLACLETATGRMVWQKNILQKFGGRNISWGICESPLIDGEKLICTPGGSRGTVVALDKSDGRTIWTCQLPGNPAASYASPIIAAPGGVRQYVLFTSKVVAGVRAEDGHGMWMDDASANGTANCSTPLFYRDHVFSASGYGTGGALVKLTSSRGNTTAARVYATKEMKNHHGGMVIIDGFLYGSNDPGVLTCIELLSGDVKWRDRSVGKGSVTFADGDIYLRSESGPVALVEASPRGYREKGRFNQPQRSGANAWPHPVVAEGRLFLRDQDVLLCYDVKANSE
ncbi:MAG: PQQ-like beta-propeller repeat protein [Planctomycetes bacterium]|nr:PQQ-like beta-propeller repeat protein [Planctomycetota bacterium]